MPALRERDGIAPRQEGHSRWPRILGLLDVLEDDLRWNSGSRMSDQPRTTITVKMPSDKKGLIGRQCPNRECGKYFKIKPGAGLNGDGSNRISLQSVVDERERRALRPRRLPLRNQRFPYRSGVWIFLDRQQR